MPITNAQIQAAEAIQDAAAHDPSLQVRLVAGPGTGKSRTIEERVRWLLAQHVPAAAIAVVSFTRASSNEPAAAFGLTATQTIRLARTTFE